MSDIWERYGEGFTGKLLDEFTLRWMDGPATTNTKRAAALRRWLKQLDAQAEATGKLTVFRSVRDKLRDCAFDQIKRVDFEHVLSDFVERASDPTDRTIFGTDVLATRRPIIEQLSAVVSQLAPSMGWPDVGVLSPKFPGLDRGTTPSLGELKREGQPAEVFAPGQEFPATVARNWERLRRLREIMEAELLNQYETYKYGKSLLSNKKLPSARLLRQAERDLEGITVLSDRKSMLPGVASRCFPAHDKELRLAAILKHIVVNHDGKVSGSRTWSTLGIRNLVSRHGGCEKLIPLLEGSKRALVCAYGIVLIESAFNVSSCDIISANAFTGKLEAGRAELNILSSVKKRPTPSVVNAMILEGTVQTKAPDFAVSGKRAIDLWLELSEPIRRRAIKESESRLAALRRAKHDRAPSSDRLGGVRVQEYLWIIPGGRGNDLEVRLASTGNFRDHWTALLADHNADPIIGGLPIRRKNIRPTLVQLKFASPRGGLAGAALLANHNDSNTTFRDYLNRPYIKAHLTDLIRKFQQLLEISLLNSDETLASKLKYSAHEFEHLRNEAVECGLAFFGEAEPPPCESESSSGDTWGPIAYSETDGGMRSAALLRLSLEAVFEEYIVRNPKRWFEIWMPLQALATAVCNMLEEGPRGPRFRELLAEMAEGLRSGEIAPFQPF
jgi:hypothetical protein